jgi:hypothetical protein
VKVIEVIDHFLTNFGADLKILKVVISFEPTASLVKHESHSVTAASSLESIEETFIEHTERRACSRLPRNARALQHHAAIR